MGLTLVAIFTAALLLPGIIAARAFYFAGQTREVEVPVPSLSTPDGIALVGGFSVLVHVAYIAALKLALALPLDTGLPLADPYRPFAPLGPQATLDVAWSFLTGLLLLCVLAAGIGWAIGAVAVRRLDKSIIYGPLAEVIGSARGDDRFITAYVVSKIAEGDRLVGYQGTVDSLFRDADRFPVKVVLRDVVPFYLALGERGPERQEGVRPIDWLVLTSEDWHNIAFRAFEIVDDKPAIASAGP